MGIVKQGQEIWTDYCALKSDNRDSQAQEMANNSEDDPYYNAVLKKNDNTEEKGDKLRRFSLRGKFPSKFKFHDESELPPPPPPSRPSASRFQQPHCPVTHSSPRITRSLPRNRQEEDTSFESNTTEAGTSMATTASAQMIL